MDIDLGTVRNEKLIIDEDFTFDSSYNNKEIKDLKNLHVKGEIYYNAIDNLELNLLLTGNMILLDSVTLEEITYPLNFEIKEEYEINEEFLQVYTKNNENILDILKILWENIVLEVPISFTNSKDAKMRGEGWSLGEDNNTEEIDPRLAKLAILRDTIGKE